MSSKRVFLLVLDSLGIGYMPDAKEYGDEGSNTLKSITKSEKYNTPNLEKLGLFNIEGVDYKQSQLLPAGSFARMAEMSKGKDTTIGHWEICGAISEKPLPTYKDGFPEEIINQFSYLTGREVLCNKPYSGTQVILDYGREHEETGALIVYTSGDSVFQIAAHEEIVPLEELYKCCQIARNIMTGENEVGRIIARPFIGKYPYYQRTSNRRDYSILPPRTILDDISKTGLNVTGIGKISDIFCGQGIVKKIKTTSNIDGMEKTIEEAKTDFEGLVFVNLVDFDMLYGHRNNINGYANAMTVFDKQLGDFMNYLKKDDIVIITADHGCDPATVSTEHSREYVPMIIFGDNVKEGIDLKTRSSFADIGATIVEYLGVISNTSGVSFLSEVIKDF